MLDVVVILCVKLPLIILQVTLTTSCVYRSKPALCALIRILRDYLQLI